MWKIAIISYHGLQRGVEEKICSRLAVLG